MKPTTNGKSSLRLPQYNIRYHLCLHMFVKSPDKRLAVHEQFLTQHRGSNLHEKNLIIYPQFLCIRLHSGQA